MTIFQPIIKIISISEQFIDKSLVLELITKAVFLLMTIPSKSYRLLVQLRRYGMV